MNRNQLEQKLIEAIRKSLHFGDIKSVSLFGSRLEGRARPDSDVDILVDFEPQAHIGFFELYDIHHDLETSLGIKVDLLTPDSLSRFFKDEVLSQARTIYEKRPDLS